MPFAEVEPYGLSENTFYKTFYRVHDVFHFVYETHLDVDLSKFGLTVCAKVFVAEAFGNLKISVEARNHQKLFIELRRLRQRVKFAGMHSRRNEIISRAFGRGLTEHRRFDFDKTVFFKELSRRKRNFVTHFKVMLKSGTTKIEVSVFKS